MLSEKDENMIICNAEKVYINLRLKKRLPYHIQCPDARDCRSNCLFVIYVYIFVLLKKINKLWQKLLYFKMHFFLIDGLTEVNWMYKGNFHNLCQLLRNFSYCQELLSIHFKLSDKFHLGFKYIMVAIFNFWMYLNVMHVMLFSNLNVSDVTWMWYHIFNSNIWKLIHQSLKNTQKK